MKKKKKGVREKTQGSKGKKKEMKFGKREKEKWRKYEKVTNK